MNLREWALPVYTILMQLATGALFILWTIRTFNLKRVGEGSVHQILLRPLMVIFFTILAAVIGSHFHLSSPFLSFLAMLNLRHSWLSREIVFTILMFFACAALVDQVRKPAGGQTRLTSAIGWAAVVFGIAAIYSMSSIYLLPTQAPWNHWSTVALFYGSSLVIGITSAVALLVMDAIFTQAYAPDLAADRQRILESSLGNLAWLAAGALVFILLLNGAQILMASAGDALAQTSLSLMLALYQPLLGLRFVALAAGVGIFALAAFWRLKRGRNLSELVIPFYLACLLSIIAEALGRFLFYASHVRLGI
jgi:anaerobic dimethyl sulfoxide reductase subunit C (anchor subunit)